MFESLTTYTPWSCGRIAYERVSLWNARDQRGYGTHTCSCGKRSDPHEACGLNKMLENCYKMTEFNQLTITHTMTGLVAVEASDRGTIKNLALLLRAGPSNVAHFIAVVALGNAAGNRLATVLQALHVLLLGLWPTDSLLGALGVRIEPKRNSELLVQVSLKVHVGVGRGKLALQADEVQWDVHVTESLFELRVGCLRASLDILEEGLLDIVHVAILNSLAEALPGNLSLDIVNLATINLAWVGASSDGVA